MRPPFRDSDVFRQDLASWILKYSHGRGRDREYEVTLKRTRNGSFVVDLWCLTVLDSAHRLDTQWWVNLFFVFVHLKDRTANLGLSDNLRVPIPKAPSLRCGAVPDASRTTCKGSDDPSGPSGMT